jgi:hypothetical protein
VVHHVGRIAPNHGASPEEIAEAIRQSDRNYAELIRALPGRILPVFHRGESPERLNEVQAMSPDYLCLSPIVRILEKRRIAWSLVPLSPSGIPALRRPSYPRSFDSTRGGSPPCAIDAAVASLALVGVRLANGKGPHLATRAQAAELGAQS